ncbi:unnamed protein product [Phytophthora lilii]|uniref:Unnamed protein product n=1 Tax=Phytophthora lilii TaxID=2077276 RepID=A0A9W6WWL7_9STRA|nr:unnamed protein product [Phytophthora lilii]
MLLHATRCVTSAKLQRLYSTGTSGSASRRWLVPTVAAGLAVAAAIALRDDESPRAGQVQPGLPTYSMRQVQQSERPCVVYRRGVYDVTEFARDHPGGTKILQAAGKSVELFWLQSEPHSRAGVPETLEELRIGNLSDEDFDGLEEVKQTQRATASESSASTALQRLFFVEGATSSPAPDVDPDAFKLKINRAGLGQEMVLSLGDLKTRFRQHRVTTTIRCSKPRATNALADKSKATSARDPAEWTGVLLVDVLASVGITTPADVEQVRFEALDTDAQGRAFGSSIPVATALDADAGVLLAYEMNGGPIPKEHGFPLRVVVLGTTGARNVKFVHRILLS